MIYPDEYLKENLNLLSDLVKIEKISHEDKEKFLHFIDYLRTNDLSFLQEKYVSIFDRQKKFSLYLFEHIHGDSRERGSAMIDLQNLYKNNKFEITESKESPDYIPLFLEFISLMEEKDAYAMLGEIINLISVIRKRLELIESPYADIFYLLESLSLIKPDYSIIEKTINKDKKDAMQSNIDKEWEEEKIF